MVPNLAERQFFDTQCDFDIAKEVIPYELFPF